MNSPTTATWTKIHFRSWGCHATSIHSPSCSNKVIYKLHSTFAPFITELLLWDVPKNNNTAKAVAVIVVAEGWVVGVGRDTPTAGGRLGYMYRYLVGISIHRWHSNTIIKCDALSVTTTTAIPLPPAERPWYNKIIGLWPQKLSIPGRIL